MTVEMHKRPFEDRRPPVRIGQKKIEPNASFCKSGVGLPLAQLIQHVLKEKNGENECKQRL